MHLATNDGIVKAWKHRKVSRTFRRDTPPTEVDRAKLAKSDLFEVAPVGEQYRSLTFAPLQEYLEEATRKWNMEIHIFSFDLISPSKSRVKIYTRAPNASLEYLMDALTIGGRDDLSRTFGTSSLMDGSARGPGFYFTTQAGKIPTPKVYISPGPFCTNDMDVLARLRRYFGTRHDAEKMLPQMDNYERALQAIYGRDYLEKTGDIHV
ncbi:hypothetical protein E8E11_006753 [Didymella keratinophila]|nr:hypothetical protein E8E11_006753 [Didymella keratinophila]